MDEEIFKQIFDELFSTLEPVETQSAALLQFLKAKGIATDEELAPFMEAAGNASNVRGRATRLRTAALISSALKPAEPVETSVPEKKEEATPEQAAEGRNDKSGSDQSGNDRKEARKEESPEATKTEIRKTEPKQTESDKDQQKAEQDATPKREAA